MENNKKNIGAIVAGVSILLFALAYYFFSTPFSSVMNEKGESENVPSSIKEPTFEKKISDDVLQKEITKPIEVNVPKDVKTEIRLYEIKAEGGKFVPNELVIPHGGMVQIQFTAVDADYDISFTPPIGAYVKAKKGEFTTFGFNASENNVGEYTFVCKDLCPKSGGMVGKLILK